MGLYPYFSNLCIFEGSKNKKDLLGLLLTYKFQVIYSLLMPSLKKTILSSTAISGFIIAIGAGSFYYPAWIIPQVEAKRVFIQNGDIYNLDSVFGAKKIVKSKDVKMLFDERGDTLLIGRGIYGRIEGTEAMGSTQLFVVDKNGNNMKQLSDATVVSAFLDKAGKKAFYHTLDSEIFKTEISNGKNVLLKTKAVQPALSTDEKALIYVKLSDQWQPGDYYENNQGIAMLNLETGKESMITHSAEDFLPFWSPDNSHIFYYSRVPHSSLISLFSVRPDGSEVTQLTNIGQDAFTAETIAVPEEKPLWSADGQSLVMESDNAVWAITLTPEYSKVKKAKKIGFGKAPKWSEKGSTVTIIATEATDPKQAVIEVDLEGNILK